MRKTCSRILLALALGHSAAFAVPSAALADLITLLIPGIPGDVTLESQKGTIEVLSLSNNILNPVQGCAGGSSCTGKAVFSDMVIQKRFDSSSPPLFLALATGKRFPNVVISFLRSSDGKFTKVFTIILSDAAVTKFETNSTADNALRGLGQEQINLSYSQIILRNDLTGKRACWNVVLNKAC